jgi:hypothetical protein
VLLAAFGLALLLAAPASAVSLDPDDLLKGACREAPTAEAPGGGLSGYFLDPPAPPPTGDPFAENPTVSVYEVYGFAGLRFNTYDLGCGGSVTDPGAAVGTTVANWIFEAPKAGAALTSALTKIAFNPGFLDIFDGLLLNVTDVLRRTIFDSYIGIVLTAVGFGILFKARRGSLSAVGSAVGWALLVMVIATVLFRFPVEAGRAADDTVTVALGAVNSGLNGVVGTEGKPEDQAAGNMHRAILYEQWLTGTFGKANSETARKYGPVIFDAQALTWTEDTLRGEERKAVVEAKAKRWEEAASKVEDEDPDAYAYLTGARSEGRIGAVFIALFALICAAPFLVISALLVLGAFLIVRLAVMFSPLLLMLGILLPTVVRGIGNVVGAAVVNSVIFGVGAAFTILSVRVLLDPASALPTWLALLLVALFSVVMFTVLRPFRRLTRMVRNPDPFADAAGAIGERSRAAVDSAKRLATNAATSGVGAYLGTKKAVEDADEDAATGTEKANPTTVRAESFTAPAPTEQAASTTEQSPAVAVAAASESPPGALPAAPVAAAIPAAAVAAGAIAPPPAPEQEESTVSEQGAIAPPVVPSQATPPAIASPPPTDVYTPEEEGPISAVDTHLPPPVEPEIVDGEEVFMLYRPEVGVTEDGPDA